MSISHEFITAVEVLEGSWGLIFLRQNPGAVELTGKPSLKGEIRVLLGSFTNLRINIPACTTTINYENKAY